MRLSPLLITGNLIAACITVPLAIFGHPHLALAQFLANGALAAGFVAWVLIRGRA